MLAQLPDEDLFKLLKNNDTKAFEELYNRYWAILLDASYRRVKSREAAKEIVQEYFLDLWKKRSTTVVPACVAAYLKSSIRYMVIAHYHRECKDKVYNQYVHLKTHHDHSTQHEIELRDLQLNLDQGIELLPLKCRTVFELSRKQYHSNKQIAHQLGISEKTVENHLTKALRFLKGHLKEFVAVVATGVIFCSLHFIF
jgi:RNA polymerase sigma-70 factor (family 1)